MKNHPILEDLVPYCGCCLAPQENKLETHLKKNKVRQGNRIPFDASGQQVLFSCEKQLYKRLCPSVCPSVRNALTKTAKTGRIQLNLNKFKQIQVNSRKFGICATIGRVDLAFNQHPFFE